MCTPDEVSFNQDLPNMEQVLTIACLQPPILDLGVSKFGHLAAAGACRLAPAPLLIGSDIPVPQHQQLASPLGRNKGGLQS